MLDITIFAVAVAVIAVFAAWSLYKENQHLKSRLFLPRHRNGNPVAVLEYQGTGHNIGGTAGRRDEIKRIALERAGFIEIKDGTTQAEIEGTIRSLLTPATTAKSR